MTRVFSCNCENDALDMVFFRAAGWLIMNINLREFYLGTWWGCIVYLFPCKTTLPWPVSIFYI